MTKEDRLRDSAEDLADALEMMMVHVQHQRTPEAKRLTRLAVDALTKAGRLLTPEEADEMRAMSQV